MRPLTLLVTLGLVAASADLRAETHRFVPTVFHNSLSIAHPPALRIRSGDRVITTTVDGSGADAVGKALAQGPNPQTGPFYIEGAEPGDLLVVTIEKLTPNRTTGFSAPILTANAVEAVLSSNKNATLVPWTIDTVKGVVRLDLGVFRGVDWGSRFSPATIELPMRPTLASIGVVPPSTNASSATVPGPSGGNLEFAGITSGTKVMLPVSERGALLSLGRGQVRQGDGQITGAVETSMDVEFSVEVVKKKEWPHSSVIRPSTVVGEFEMGWPRLETTDYIMAVGSAPSLQQALQRATLEVHHWLDDDFGLNERAVSIFMGQAVEYEIANVSGPSFTVVAKVRKSYLPRPIVAP